ncbi:phosphohistidine phosphatase SixA [Rhodoferax koreense]|uniref:Phosphohistidine phosphatase SixA n=1 Tax=Rhodoferax koreensis TaxID=1842727 RepID=A0A1P8JW20_9BURK|nr:phosphohistidine phosphatase SixA [Rhodoferax koreense]APW37947.1 phosphohistidine phosphatase SixA [Rhodoferax koreense]
MDLILWRHAEAEDEREGLSDMDRSLTAKGQKQASRMAAWLDRQLPESTRVLASPARRTEQTVHALGRKYKLRPELAPGATPAQLLEAAQWPDSKAAVLIVGHQPTLGHTIAQLLGLDDPNFAVKKGAVWWLRQRERDGQAQTVLVAVQAPETI